MNMVIYGEGKELCNFRVCINLLNVLTQSSEYRVKNDRPIFSLSKENLKEGCNELNTLLNDDASLSESHLKDYGYRVSCLFDYKNKLKDMSNKLQSLVSKPGSDLLNLMVV